MIVWKVCFVKEQPRLRFREEGWVCKMSGIDFPTERLTRLALRRQTSLEKVAFIPIISVSNLNAPTPLYFNHYYSFKFQSLTSHM
ncbi:MAG: hypothetical protein ACFFBD_12335 [Candidatus Hodarchaeota archaeon]